MTRGLRMIKVRPCMLPILLMVTLVASLSVGTLTAYAATPPEPTYGTANVDGNYGEWDLINDHFAHMYRAGNPLKPIESHLYLRYDCETNTLYALVLAEPGVLVLPQPDEAYIKLGTATKLVDGNSGNDGIPPDFAWVQSNSDYIGWEASAPLAAGNYTNLNVHVQVFDDDAAQTSAVANRAIELWLQCPVGFSRICVEKTALADNITAPFTIPYSFQVCNPGDFPLSDVTVTDPICDDPPAYQGGDNSPANGLLDPGEVWEYSCNYYFEGPSAPGVCVVNIVSVTGTHDGETVTDEHPAEVHCSAPPEGGIRILKTVDKEHACPGQTLLYRYEVTNLGDAPLHSVQVTDDSCSPIVGPDGDADRDQELDPDETWVYICRSVVAGREPNPLENRVIASAYEPQVGATFVDRHPGIVQIVPCPQPEFVPEVGTILLLTTGLAGMAGYAGLRIRRRS